MAPNPTDSTGSLESKPEVEIVIPTRPTPLPSNSHLKGAENYDVWCIQLCGLIGQDAYKVMVGETERGKGGSRRKPGIDSTILSSPPSPSPATLPSSTNCTIVEGLISLLSQAGAPKDLWAEALQAFVFVKNRSPHAALDGKVPLSVWRDCPVSISMLRVWGCRAWHTVTNGRSKLDDKAIPLVFVGYDDDTTAYGLFDPETRKMIRSRDTRFVDNEFPLANPSSLSSESPSSVITPADIVSVSIPPASPPPSPSVNAPTTPIARCSAPDAPRAHRDFTRRLPDPPAPPIFEREVAPPPESPDPLDCLTVPFGSTLAEVDALVASAGSELEAAEDNFTLPSSDPRNHREAMQDSDSDRWRSGEDDEFTSLRDEYKVFHSVDRDQLPSNAKVIGCRFVFRRKKDQHGRVSGHKVRLVAQGFSQRPGVDFRETFAPVAKFVSIRVLLALAARNNLLIHQADVDKAYLHGALDEEIYMRVPEGIDGYDGKVLKLDRALYGLKQAGRVWNHRIDAT
ncbi:hypothetical protein JCM16303_005276, partial [Sporobolomyces ruberrimus]